jgi:hypothetical protein
MFQKGSFVTQHDSSRVSAQVESFTSLLTVKRAGFCFAIFSRRFWKAVSKSKRLDYYQFKLN